MVKKASTFLFVGLFTIALLFSGCSKNNETRSSTGSTAAVSASTAAKQAEESSKEDTGGLTLPITEKPATLSAIAATTFADREKTWYVQELAKRTGIRMEVEEVPGSQWTEKLKIVVASGKLPDILCGLTLNEFNSLGVEGALTPINNYLNELPNFRALFSENKDNSWIMNSYSAEDNNLYMWPLYNIQRDVNHGLMYRKDILEKYGLKEWTTTEEFYEVMKKLKEAVPDSIPFINKAKERIFLNLSYGWGLGNETEFPMYFDENGGQWKLAGIQPEWKNMLDFMKKMYNEGILDPEFITCTPESFTTKMSGDKSFVTWDWIGRMELFYQQVKANNPGYDLRYANPIGPTGKIQRLLKVELSGYGVAKNDKSPIALKLLDYLTSPAGMRLSTMGAEGATYTKDASGNISYTGIEEPVDINKLADKYGVFVQGLYTRVDPESIYFKFTEKEKEAQDKMLNSGKIDVYDPILKFNTQEKEVVNEMLAMMKKEVNEFSSKYVIDKNYGDSQWNEWIKRTEALNAQKLVDAYNQAQTRYKK